MEFFFFFLHHGWMDWTDGFNMNCIIISHTNLTYGSMTLFGKGNKETCGSVTPCLRLRKGPFFLKSLVVQRFCLSHTKTPLGTVGRVN